MARWSSGLRLRPLTPATAVRIRYGSPTKNKLKKAKQFAFEISCVEHKECRCNRIGVYGDEGPPVPIPNTVVKLINAENTWLEAARENRTTPIQSAGLNNIKPAFFKETEYALIAQSVEHAAVNRGVTGSSPVWGAKSNESELFILW